VQQLANPTEGVDLSFARYLEQRQAEQASRSERQVPSYSFAMDGALRQQLAAIGPLRSVAQLLSANAVPLYKQLFAMEGVAVGPRQFETIYAAGEACARRLGIGIPQIFVVGGMAPNAFTIATDDVAPIVVLTSSLVELLEPAELQFVIGHECGHIHNLHGVYNTAVELISNPAAQLLVQNLVSAGVAFDTVRLVAAAVQGGLKLFMMHWSRCAEVTCDRAGLICCGDAEAAERALVKLVVGASPTMQQINVDAYLRQLRSVSLPLRHPLIPKRIEALRLFAGCETLQAWRPELATGALRSREETDELCKAILAIVKGKRDA
jgi:Zn-dependent protease with chaperone function